MFRIDLPPDPGSTWKSEEPVDLVTLRKGFDALCNVLAEKDKRLREAEKLFDKWLMNEINHVFQNTTLQERTRIFLASFTQPPSDEGFLPCKECGKPNKFTPKTELGRKLMALREKSIAAGTTTEERLELRRWSAEGLMGWKSTTVKITDSSEIDNVWVEEISPGNIIYHWKSTWAPDSEDSPASQILSVIKRMKELGHFLQIEDEGLESEEWSANYGFAGIYSTDLLLAILLAAKAAGVKEETPIYY